MSLTLFFIGLIIFIVGLPWLAAAVGMTIYGLRALAKGCCSLFFPRTTNG